MVWCVQGPQLSQAISAHGDDVAVSVATGPEHSWRTLNDLYFHKDDRDQGIY